MTGNAGVYWEFLSTPSARRATPRRIQWPAGLYISIHALREEGDLCLSDIGLALKISIHALREEGDPRQHSLFGTFAAISIHALREEGDRCTATGPQRPCAISIHALREEGDERDARTGTRYKISIHALREEGDRSDLLQCRLDNDFYPRPPRGGRLFDFLHCVKCFQFLSTPSARRATTKWRSAMHGLVISIHALREEGDYCLTMLHGATIIFLSTPSARRAT